MASDRNKNLNIDEKKSKRRSVISGSCKPCMPIERDGNNKNEKIATTKNPLVSQTLDASSCYAKCASPSAQDSSSTANGSTTTTAVPTKVGSCYTKCGPPFAQPDLSSTSTGSASTVKPQDDSESCQVKSLSITNPYIEKMDEDILYHVALGNKSHDLVNMFSDIRFVVMGGTPKRMEQFAYFMANQLKHELPHGTILNDISKNSHRYSMFKVGPILSVSHGMGTPSIGILLHELIKLMSHANIKDPTFVRIGTCGGFNKKAGTVVVSNKVVNDFMEPFYELTILGKKVRFPANLNQAVVNEILSSSEPEDKFETIAGATYCTDNFYEGCGRADGAICEFSEQEGLNYYKDLQRNGVVNMEMESLAFAALTCRAGIKSAIVTVILSDRLETDEIKHSKEVLDEWQTRPQRLLAKYIKKKLSISDFSDSSNCTTSTTKLPVSSSTSAGSTICDTSTTKPTAFTSTTAPFTSTVCKSCGGTGTEKKSDNGSNTLKSADDTSLATSSSAGCKPRENACKIESSNSTTNKPTDFISSTTPLGSATCPTCKGTGKESRASLVSKCTRSNLDPNANTTKPSSESTSTTSASSVCKSCFGSGKTSDANISTQVSSTTTRSPDMVVCKCCGGAGVVPHKKDNDVKIPTIKPFFASDSSVRKPSPEWLNKDGQTASSSTAAPKPTKENASYVCKLCTPGGSTSTPRSDGTTTGVPYTQATSNTCRPCTSTASAAVDNRSSTTTTLAPNVGSSSVCKPCMAIGSSTTTLTPNVGSSNVCKPCMAIGSPKTTLAPNDGNSSVCKPCMAIDSPKTTLAPNDRNSSVCKPCMAIGSPTITSGSTTSAPYRTGFGSCKPCISITTPTTNTTSAAAPLNSISELPAYLCKPCEGSTAIPTSTSTTTDAPSGTAVTTQNIRSGTSNCKPGSNPPTSRSGPLAGELCKPCGGGIALGTTSGTTTDAPSNASTTAAPQSSFQNVGICPRNTGSTTFGTTGGTTTTSQPGFTSEELCQRNTGNINSRTTGGTSTCRPGSNPPTSQYKSYDGVCKPYTNGSTTEMPRDLTTTTSGTTSTPPGSNPFGVCRPCSGGNTSGTTTTRRSSLIGFCESNTGTRSAADGTSTTTVPSEISSSTCKSNTTSLAPSSTTSTASQPSVRGSGCNMNLDVTNNATDTVQRKQSECVPFICRRPSDKTDTTPLPTTPKAYMATDFDSSSKSTISNDSWRSCHQKCSSKASNAGGGMLSTNKPQTFQTPEQDKMKGVPPALGPCCVSKDAVEFREVSDVKGPVCAANSNEDQIKTTESSLERRSSQDQTKTESVTERRPSMGHLYIKSLLDKPNAMDQLKTELSLQRRTSSDVTRAPNDNQVVSSQLGSCCTGRSNGVIPRPVTSNKLGSCCSGQSDKPEEITTMRPADTTSTDVRSGNNSSSQESSAESATAQYKKSEARNNGGSGSQSTGKFCTGIEDDSPDQDCGSFMKSQTSSYSKTGSKSTASKPFPRNILQNNEQSQDTSTLKPDADFGGTTRSKSPGRLCSGIEDDSPDQDCGSYMKSQASSYSETDSKSTTSRPMAGNIPKDNGTSTPKPSPETPDTSTNKAMPTFVTPTPPSSTGIICYSKFTNSNGVLITTSINKEANKYDESPSPCAACKKYQESEKRSTDSTPDIIKCPHKLKRLKDECQGYD